MVVGFGIAGEIMRVIIHNRNYEYAKEHMQDLMKDKSYSEIGELIQNTLTFPVGNKLLDVSNKHHLPFLESFAARRVLEREKGLDYCLAIKGLRRPQTTGEVWRSILGNAYVPINQK